MEARDLVQAHLYNSEEEVVRDALRHLLRARPEARIQVAVHRYRTEEISLARAAGLAGVSWAQMKEILREKGVAPRLGAEGMDEARAEVEVLENSSEPSE